MRYPRIRRPRKLGFNMTPMIDVVFLLIIFFLVSSHLAQRESNIKLELPVAESADEDPAAPRPRLTINVQNDGRLILGGREVPTEMVAGRLALAKQELGDDLEVRLRSSRETPYGQIVPIMLACSRQGIWNVTFAVYREDR